MKFRKLAAMVLAIVMIFSFAACDNTPIEGDGSQTTDDTSAEETSKPPAPPYQPNPPLPAAEEIPFPGYDPLAHEMRDITSWELISEMTFGWNMGNTFDAPREQGWGNPRTTYAMINAVKNAGFDSFRLPVTWENHTGSAPEYLINEEYMDRIEEVVQWVLSLGMFCILNTHHEEPQGNSDKGWLFPDEENEEYNTMRLVTLWGQIAERFKDYNEFLIFEGMNEPRLKGTRDEWNGGTLESQRVINRMNQAFVDTIRDFGGRNAKRHLMLPTYAASANREPVEVLSRGFPKDDDKVIASVHAYIPHSFALRNGGTANWSIESSSNRNDIDWMFNRLQEHFIDKKIPVIMGETGAVDRAGNLQARVEWTGYFFGTAKEKGIPCFWWDNGLFYREGSNGEHFGLMNRTAAQFVFPEILEAIMK